MFSSILSSILSSSSFSSKDVSLKTIGNYYNRFKYYNQSQENLENLNKFECLIPLKSGKEFKISNSKLILKNRIESIRTLESILWDYVEDIAKRNW